MKKFIGKLLFYIKKVYRISLNYKKYENIVWNDLVKLHKDSKWNYGVYEADKHIETNFEISENVSETYFYMLYDNHYHCRVKVLTNFPQEYTTEIFVLAAHFNNLLNNGMVIVNVNSGYVEYHTKSDYLVNLIYPGNLNTALIRHFNVSKDIYWAFNKLIKENEEPTFIIADLLRKNEQNNNNT